MCGNGDDKNVIVFSHLIQKTATVSVYWKSRNRKVAYISSLNLDCLRTVHFFKNYNFLVSKQQKNCIIYRMPYGFFADINAKKFVYSYPVLLQDKPI